VCRFHFRGVAGYVIHAWQIAGGLALCLLGLLGLGSRSVWFDTSRSIQYGNALYRLVAANWGIAVVFLVYAAVQAGYMVRGHAASLTPAHDGGGMARLPCRAGAARGELASTGHK
jgi:hypothetical protein